MPASSGQGPGLPLPAADPGCPSQGRSRPPVLALHSPLFWALPCSPPLVPVLLCWFPPRPPPPPGPQPTHTPWSYDSRLASLWAAPPTCPSTQQALPPHPPSLTASDRLSKGPSQTWRLFPAPFSNFLSPAPAPAQALRHQVLWDPALPTADPRCSPSNTRPGCGGFPAT